MFSSTHTAYKSKLLAIYLCWWKLVASACLEALPQKVQKSSITDPERSQCGWRGGNDGQIWTNVLSQSVLCDTLCQLAQSCAARTWRDSLQELICMPTGQLMDHSQAVAAPNPNTKQLRTFHPDSQQDRSRLNRVLRDGPNPLAAESIPNDLGSWDSLAQRSHVFSTSAPLPPGWPCRAAAIVAEFCPHPVMMVNLLWPFSSKPGTLVASHQRVATSAAPCDKSWRFKVPTCSVSLAFRKMLFSKASWKIRSPLISSAEAFNRAL